MESRIVFGKMLDYYRQENQMTMEELGKKMGKTKSAVSRWISGENYPKIDDIEKLAALFNTDVETLVFGLNTHSTGTRINDTVSKLTEDRQEKVLGYAEIQLEEQEKDTK